MANNKPNGVVGTGPRLGGPRLDPNSPEAQAMIKKMDEERAGQDADRDAYYREMSGAEPGAWSGQTTDPAPELYIAGLSDIEAELAEKYAADSAAAVTETEPETPENRDAVEQAEEDRRRAVFERGVALSENQTGQLTDEERAATNAGAVDGQVWRGQARYTDGEPPVLIRTPDGRMWYKQGPYVSPVKDGQEAAFLVGLDSQMAKVQETRKKNRVEEMELAAALETMNDESATFQVFNQRVLSERLARYGAEETPEVLELLRPLYEDANLMSRLQKLNPGQFIQALDQMEMILRGGGSASQVRAAGNSALRGGGNRINAVRADVANGLRNQLETLSNEMDANEDEINKLNLDIAREKGKIEQFDTEANPHLLQALIEQRDALAGEQKGKRSAYSRIESSLEKARSESGADWTTEYGGATNLDQLWEKSRYKRSLNKMGGPVWCIMDSVARDNGLDGLDDARLLNMLDGNVEAVAEFIRECQGYARSAGWETSDDNTRPWIEAIIQHVLQTVDPDQVTALVQSAMSTVPPGADFPYAPPEEAGAEAAAAEEDELMTGTPEEMARRGMEVLDSFLSSPSVAESIGRLESGAFDATRSRINSGYRSPNQSSDSKTDVTLLATVVEGAGGDKAALNRVVEAYLALPERIEDPGEMVPLDQMGAGGSTVGEYPWQLTQFEQAIINEVGRDTYALGLNIDNVLPEDRSDEAWKKVEDAARSVGAASKMNPSEIREQLDVMESRRRGRIYVGRDSRGTGAVEAGAEWQWTPTWPEFLGGDPTYRPTPPTKY